MKSKRECNRFMATIKDYMLDVGRRAKAAARQLSRAATGDKNAALHAMADALQEQAQALITANADDPAALRAMTARYACCARRKSESVSGVAAWPVLTRVSALVSCA